MNQLKRKKFTDKSKSSTTNKKIKISLLFFISLGGHKNPNSLREL